MSKFLKTTLITVSVLIISNVGLASETLMVTVHSNGNYQTHSQNPLGTSWLNYTECSAILSEVAPNLRSQFKTNMAAKGWVFNCN